MHGRIAAVGALAVGLLLVGPVAAAPNRGMALVFQRTWGAPTAAGADVAVAPDGSVYTVDSIGVGEPPYATTEVILLRWSAEGDLLWQRQWGGPNDDDVAAVATDASGSAYVTGLSNSFGYVDAFVVKFDADGNLVWQRTWGGDREDGGEGIAVGPDGSVYVAGFTQSFGSFFGAAGFLLKFSSDGMPQWQRTWHTPGGSFVEDVIAAADGAVYLVGNWGNAPLRPFVAKFTAGGDLVWDRTILAPGYGGYTSRFLGIAPAPDGSVVAVGRWMPTFDGQVLFVRFSGSGALLQAYDWGGDSHEEGVDVAVASDGVAYVVGGTNTFAQGSYEDLFILKVLPNAHGREVRTWGGPNQDLADGIAVGPNGDMYVAGTASIPPYGFRSAPSQMFAARGVSVAGVDAIVATPAGMVSAPTGTVTTPDGIVGTEGSFNALLLRVTSG